MDITSHLPSLIGYTFRDTVENVFQMMSQNSFLKRIQRLSDVLDSDLKQHIELYLLLKWID